MLPHSGGKSLKYNITISAIKSPMAIDAYSTETIKVIVMQPIIPSKAVCHEKYLKVGLKFGALARSKAKQAKFTPKYANK